MASESVTRTLRKRSKVTTTSPAGAETVLRLTLMRSVIVWRVQVKPVCMRLVGGEGPRVGYRQGVDRARLGLGPVRLTARQ